MVFFNLHDYLEIGTRRAIIGKDVEAKLVKWVIEMSEIGQGQAYTHAGL